MFIGSREIGPLATLLDCIQFYELVVELVQIPMSAHTLLMTDTFLRDRIPQMFDYISPIICGPHDFIVYELIYKL